ncbi:phenoloxidase-activating factor 2-like [Coccinella septempunctata]|uniref:phenoloxidase-activating factor 2-like n=1 Tax=Coccinella septempunctata TaxID=41139 RepID=UPI001D08E7B5|nr:phenoloxidase-activating factor 2-like [Coccinella septempunctata]
MFSVPNSCIAIMLYAVVFLAFLVHSGSSQGLLPNGDPYFCVPSGICPMTGGGIDPRIITPGGGNGGQTEAPSGGVCPSGRYVCYAQGSSSNCGQRLVPITNTNDGEAQFGAYPWQAYMTGSNGAYIGSGSLLSPYHVLTAAHKVLAYESNPSQLTIIMGVNDPANINNSPAAPRSTAAQITIFNRQTYNNETLKNNLAIVRLANPISLVNQNSINTICLPSANTNANAYVNPSQRCIVSGWGQAQPSNSPSPTKLKQVMVNTVDINTCESGFNGRVDTSRFLDKSGGQICAGGESQRDACFQDGGAPLTCGQGTLTSRFTVSGIVIWGKSCGLTGVYGVYTNVPYYRQWIVQTITQPIP